MKNVIPTLKTGDRLQAEIIECLSATELICSFEGDLLRVQNLSATPLKPGQQIHLKVLSTNPLKFGTTTRQGPLSRHA
ncbi:MAG TPA: hypothetical protein PL182_07670 [Pseudobdellovibrionaceae bacterium]|mgnify:CR=1 FL=1|nr:hypothetical protein [Pseudobdellovibrionaceae bacterium]